MRKLTTKEFRHIFKLLYPGLDLDPAYWRFMRYLIFGEKDTLTGFPVIDMFHVAKAEGKVALFRTTHCYVAIEFLIRFQRDVMSKETFSWSDWSHKDKRARIAFVIFPPEIVTLIEKERFDMTSLKDKVYFDTGNAMRSSLQKLELERIRQESLTYYEFAIPEAKPLLTYMNNLPTNSFSKIISSNFKAAFEKACQIEDHIKMVSQVDILGTIREDLKPFYKPSERQCTDRIFPCNQSIPMLRRDIRKVLTKGWYEFDLANSQLAIVAKLWNVPLVKDFLTTNKSIWTTLFNHYELDLEDLKINNVDKYNALKSIFKTSLYSLVFGMSKPALISEIDNDLKPYNFSKPGIHFFKHSLMNALYIARETQIEKINREGEGKTIFGVTRKVYGDKKSNGKPSKERLSFITSILAHQAQSVELYLLLPVVELASTTKDFHITLWQHDGFSIHFNSTSRIDRWIPRILQVVQQKIDEQGILTHLEWELL